MNEDAVMQRIRAVRRKMWEEAGCDLERYLERIRLREGEIRREEPSIRFLDRDAAGSRTEP